jgi:hypothetical protein
VPYVLPRKYHICADIAGPGGHYKQSYAVAKVIGFLITAPDSRSLYLLYFIIHSLYRESLLIDYLQDFLFDRYILLNDVKLQRP